MNYHGLRRIVLYVVTLLVVAHYFGGCGRRSGADERLVFGMLPADAPFMAINDQGSYEGFDVDVAHAIGRQLGKEVEIKDMGFPELFIALDRKKIDLVMCGLSITAARQEKMAMVHYQGSGVSHFPLVFWQRAPEGVRQMADLQGRNMTIAVLPGTLQEDFARQFPFVTVKVVGSYSDIILELQYRKVDAALFDEAINGFVSRFPELVVVQVPIGQFESKGHGIALRLNDKDRATQVEQAVAQLRADGTIARLEQKWHMGEQS